MASPAARVCEQRAAAQGLGSSQEAVRYRGQDFETLRQQCLDSGVLFKDPEFPACPSALGYKDLGPGSPQTQGIVWKRPPELCPSPHFIVGGATRTDICQGGLGDCWLLAAIASLTLKEELLYRVVPRDQSFQRDYAGIFHFQFWQYGEWVDVVVDDRLPTKDGRLLFLHSEEGSEFWSALLEKAYAKLNGSYEALAGGSTVEGFEDFTGGISEFFDLKTPPASLYPTIRKALRMGSLLACSIDVSSAAETEVITSQKLVKSHAYSVTGVEEVDFCGRPEKLIRLRNPWGAVEWTGAWSDNAPEWNHIDPRQKEELDRQVEDGEFWMSFSDFLRQFSRLEICNLSPDSLSSEEVHKWNLVLFNGRWTRGSTAGGCQNYPGASCSLDMPFGLKISLPLEATYWTNPQFKIRLDEVGEHPQEGSGEPCCMVLLGLMQKNRRRQKRMGRGLLSIGYAVYKVPKELESHTGFFLGHQPSARSSAYINWREVPARARLPPGEYLVGPSTFEPSQDGDFCPRVFSEKKLRPSEADGDEGQPHGWFEKLAGKSNGTGTLELAEFKTLWLKIQKYLEIYLETDDNDSGTIDAQEMRTALKKAGFTLNNQAQQAIATRAACSKLSVDFDGFVTCMIHVETLFKLFKLLDKDRNGIVSLSLAEAVLCVGLSQGCGLR